MSGAETCVDGATATAASAVAAPPAADNLFPAAAAAAGPALAPFAAASTKEAALYYHCDEWFLRTDTRAALQSFFLSDVGAQLSKGAVDLLLCFLQRLTRWVLIRTRTLSLDQSEWDDPDSSWGSHNEFGGEGEEEVHVFDGRRPHVEWWLKRLCPRWLFADLQSQAREEMDKLKGSNLEGHPNLSCVTLWRTLPGSAALNDRPRSCYPRGDRLPAASQLFLGCALDFVVERVAERTEMMYRCVNVHDHVHGRRYPTGQHPHALVFLAEWTADDSYFQCGVCQLYGLVNLYRCPCDSCDFNSHARCFIPRAEDNQNNTSGSSGGGAAALDGEPEKKRQRVDETGAPAGTAAASASSSSAAATAQSAAGSSSVATPLVWGVAELSAGLSEAGVRILSDRLGMLRELGGAREAELEADPPQWQWPTEEPNNFLTPQALEAPFDHAKSGEKPLISNTLAHIRDLLQRYAWFHDPEQIAEVKQRFLSGALAGHPLWQQRRRVRPVAYYGRSWKPRWTMPDACIAEKVAYHNLSLKEQQEVDEWQEEDEEDLFGVRSTHGTYPCDTVAFDLIDGAGREWPLLLEYRECN